MQYLGNKTRMINNIDAFISELGIKVKNFCDLFAGSSSVADYFKDRYKILLYGHIFWDGISENG